MLSHRGPDDGAWWADEKFFLGHRRLSIIDLGMGSQPMATADGRYIIVFNGEIYNYIELRDELSSQGCVFRTTSDTEVILEGYRVFGIDLPKYLIGMFAFAIVDRIEQTLYLSRDRFGEKPLFISESDSGISFASELGPIAALSWPNVVVDRTALAEYLCLNYVPGERTMIHGIRRLVPGTWRLYSAKTIQSGTYWTPPSPVETAMNIGEATIELRSRLDQAVNIALRSDVPITLFLSGGIDSSIIAESAVRQGHLQHAYCLNFAEESYSELFNASQVANRLGIELRRVDFSAEELGNFLQLVEHADDPLADSSALAVWTLARATAKDYKVVISGDGGDELFGGYLTYKATMLHCYAARILPDFACQSLAKLANRLPVGDRKVSLSYKLMRFLRATDLSPAQAHFTWNGTWLPSDASNLMHDEVDRGLAYDVLNNLVSRHHLSMEPDLLALQRADATDYLPNDILTKVDRMTMAHGLEARAPFLVPIVAEFGLSIPAKLKLTPFGQPKLILRELATQLFGPKIGTAKKQGFSIPVHRWLRGPMRPMVEDLLSKSSIDQVGLLNTDAVLSCKQRHMSGQAQLGFELWGLMVLVAWYRARILGGALKSRSNLMLRQISIPLPNNSVRVP